MTDSLFNEILLGAPTPQDGKIGDLRTAVGHKGSMFLAMKTGINHWEYSFPFTRSPQIRHFHRGEDISGGAITGPIDYIDFNKDFAAPEHREGRIFYDRVNKTWTGFVDNPDVGMQFGQENWLPVRNESGVTINDGEVVFISGASTGMPTVETAKADVPTTADRTIGIATHNIENNIDGYVTTFGKVRNIDTSAWSPGDILYVDASTAGALTNVQPEYPNYIIKVATVVTSDIATGEITVNVSGRIEDILENGWNGGFLESIDFTVTSAAGTITGHLERNGGGNLTMNFSDGFTILDTTPALDVILTPGTDAIPQTNYVYVPKNTKILTVSTSDWPVTEHIKVATIILRTAATTALNGALGNRNWNDHVAGGTGSQGHIKHISERLRLEDAKWHSGVEGSVTINTGPTPDEVFVAVTSGAIYQLHRQTFPVLDMGTGDDIHVVNDSIAAYKTLTDLGGQTLDANGNSLANSSFSFVVWGVMNRSGEPSHLMVNLPTGNYGKNSPSDAVSDASNFSVYDIPAQFQGVGFLIARFTFVLQSGGLSWSLFDTQDLRGFTPNTSAGGGAGGGGVSTFLGLTDTPSAYTGQAGRFATVNAGETALEFGTALYWDEANGRLGIGANSPGATLPTGWNDNVLSKLVEIRSGHSTTDAGLFLRRVDDVTGMDIWMDGNVGTVYIDSRFNSSAAQLIYRMRTAGTPVTAMTVLGTGDIGYGISPPTQKMHLYDETATSVNIAMLIERSAAGSGAELMLKRSTDTRDAAVSFYHGSTRQWRAGLIRHGGITVPAFTISTVADTFVTDPQFAITADGNVGINKVAPLAKCHIDQSNSSGAIPVLTLDQADISDGFINFIGSDRGVITGATNSLKSVRVELGGVIYRLALFVDA